MTNSPSDPDPLVAKLLSLFKDSSTPQDEIIGLGNHGVVPLAGMPIEQAAQMVRSYYHAGVLEEIGKIQADTDRFGPFDPADWIICASPYLFPDSWVAIEGIELVREADPIPDWSILIIRSAKWWSEQLALQVQQHARERLTGTSSQFLLPGIRPSMLRDFVRSRRLTEWVNMSPDNSFDFWDVDSDPVRRRAAFRIIRSVD